CLFRYNGLSLVYLLYLLLLPWFLWPNKHTLRGHTGRFIKALFCTSLLFLLAHVSFQICLYTIPDLDHALGHNCSLWETLSRHVGVSRLPLDDVWSVVRLLTPDLGVFVISLVTLVVCNRLVKKRDDVTVLPVASDSTQGVNGFLLYRHRLGFTAMLLLIWDICSLYQSICMESERQ
ncbi:piezo-type mechanosensitive ion channel component 1-like, partial [Coregonus clupeaformis]|uniref:piezo-type mechanosensitive ion channel component 1-like n=1 Tax=Coregonus clupeaformis TaxID=59861 RepID=UPI001E1C85A5